MDMTLEERIAASKSGSRGNRRGPLNGVRKNDSRRGGRRRIGRNNSTAREEEFDEGKTWTHDKWAGNNDAEDTYDNYGDEAEIESEPLHTNGRARNGNQSGRQRDQNTSSKRGVKVLISDLHPEITPEQLAGVFGGVGGLRDARIYWERDRSTGRGHAIYGTLAQAEAAVRDFNGQLANGQRFYVKLDPGAKAPGKSLESRITYPDRDPEPVSHRSDPLDPDPPNIDRYIPDRRDAGRVRVPRQRDRARGGESRRGGRSNRPRKTKEDLDAEMDDYFGGGAGVALEPKAGAEEDMDIDANI
ncbi:hypothetical protein K469DRAFT_303327 [Zopfia rhizophila CBS 207.26]|uniref:RRM domain-containing protein n=1 Tax=Zopfia rhizophila CBS 207.26 TaxID=1314779 RepID=A0A6A6DKF0_9PEZI|nr:hypothetical protein K469DRAFT_303327 [Zopfia rhizophila CBS 207.26]